RAREDPGCAPCQGLRHRHARPALVRAARLPAGPPAHRPAADEGRLRGPGLPGHAVARLAGRARADRARAGRDGSLRGLGAPERARPLGGGRLVGGLTLPPPRAAPTPREARRPMTARSACAWAAAYLLLALIRLAPLSLHSMSRLADEGDALLEA